MKKVEDKFFVEGNRLILNIQRFATFSDFAGTKKFLEKKRILFFKRAQKIFS